MRKTPTDSGRKLRRWPPPPWIPFVRFALQSDAAHRVRPGSKNQPNNPSQPDPALPVEQVKIPVVSLLPSCLLPSFSRPKSRTPAAPSHAQEHRHSASRITSWSPSFVSLAKRNQESPAAATPRGHAQEPRIPGPVARVFYDLLRKAWCSCSTRAS